LSSQPVQIELDRTRELRITWADGVRSRVPLAVLRRACPCAACRAQREALRGSGGLPVVPAAAEQRGMALADTAELVGQYGLRITWKDGHSTGIYDYELLRSLERAPRPEGGG
jgi:DUF971 family protein